MGFRRRNQGKNSFCSGLTGLLLSICLATPLPLVLSHWMIWTQGGDSQGRPQPPYKTLSTPETLYESSILVHIQVQLKIPSMMKHSGFLFSMISVLCFPGKSASSRNVVCLGSLGGFQHALPRLCKWWAAASWHQLTRANEAHLFPTPAHDFTLEAWSSYTMEICKCDKSGHFLSSLAEMIAKYLPIYHFLSLSLSSNLWVFF